MNPTLQDIPRHKTAIGQITLSRPVKLALADGLIDPETPLFDYGCGRGDDLRILSAMGYAGTGWDPVHRPMAERQAAPVVNLGYVVNVIEDLAERRETLRRAWQLAERVSYRWCAAQRQISLDERGGSVRRWVCNLARHIPEIL